MRRLDVAIGLAGDPELLFLDEPTTGLDPAARRAAWAMVEGLKSLGKTVLLTTHYIEEAEYLADRVAIIAGGRIVAEGTPAELRSRSADTVISFRAEAVPAGLPPDLAASVEHGHVVIRSNDPAEALYRLTGWARGANVPLEDLRAAPLSLEDVYLQLSEARAESAA